MENDNKSEEQENAPAENDIKQEEASAEETVEEGKAFTSEFEAAEASDNDADNAEEEEVGTHFAPKPEKKKRRRKKGHGRLVFGLLLAAIIVSAAILCAVIVLKYSKEFLGIDKSDIEIVVEIPLNSSTEDIANQLQSEGIITSPYLFRFFSRVKGSDGTYVAGPHTLSPKMTYSDMVEELQTGAVDERETADIVFPEGITLVDAAQLLEDKNVCGKADFLKAFNTSEFGFDFEAYTKVSSLKLYKMEGYLFPDTYTFYVEEDARTVAKKIYKNFEAKITPDYYGRMNDLGMDLEEVLTLASMVQAEGQTKSDMKKIASVFLNRLAEPNEYPLLQSDPTRKYVEDVIVPNIDFQSKEMNKAYDTYSGAGLPPGPICNPGIAAIDAVLYPAETDYYYFCANVNTGEIFYAATLEEHEANLVLAGIE